MAGDDILSCGGAHDATVAAAAVGAAAGSPLEVAVLPGGTLNHFADLELPVDDQAAALDVAAAGEVTLMDLGDVNRHMMPNTSSVGDYVDFGRRRESLSGPTRSRYIS